ncbi:MAG: hypothetical protein A2504_06180 [Bdellovibrionales bacterium RIFOXYD12_FULL_39_22]|nr:MAG: hypothetical protein A2485_06035 [Bdellovibrionales bacterium RIFOXYC12_FULL_39_17]OFZ77414.1 MAG: hypothetical protein A2560_08670 [Bdellovibrionales bacterium RIFOXYD1_FULL_39_84]OFZ91543.1 MAG: hypothetical protein A2504_06180 [Bdellovibrionales bacterium RIFOXYD12_FULL_39_22]HLE11999.1 hypothetical protein [Bacteriovoracaceae bacterium]
MSILIFFLIGLYFLGSGNLLAASAVDTLENSSIEIESPTLITETIQRISPTKRIFIISNNSNAYFPGDYISIIFRNELVARGITAKQQDNISGIKILHIDSTPLWKLMREGLDVQILRGDDSYFRRKTLPEALAGANIDTEEDLYNETSLVDDDLEFDENKDRGIKTDNVITANYGMVAGVNNDFAPATYLQPYINWAYQIGDNIWTEFCYGVNLVEDFPSLKLATRYTNITARIKYTVSTPFYSYLLPYIGYQMTRSYNPVAGTPGDDKTAEELENEKRLMDALQKDDFIFGATLLKRLVPGWFLRIDVGTDIVGGGFGLEF